jgi:hypothetical protein
MAVTKKKEPAPVNCDTSISQQDGVCYIDQQDGERCICVAESK